jgi:hypothetical protein
MKGEHLLAFVKAMQERTEIQIYSLASKMETVEDKMETSKAGAKADREHMQEMIRINQERMKAKIDANRKADQEHMKEIMERQIGSLVSIMEADRKTDRDERKQEMKEAMQAIQDQMNDRQEEMKAQIASLTSRIEDNNQKFEVLQGTLVSQMGRHREKMEDAMHSIRSELDETRVELQELKTSLDTRTENFQETLETIRVDFITDLALVDPGAKRTRKDALALMEEKIEANKREFQAQVEEVKVVAERGSRPTPEAGQ